jgi:DNA-binding transcriptional ArsR family regulator
MNHAVAQSPGSAMATLAQLKALADPLRFRVFENLIAEPRTAKQMAEHLGTHPTRLYHHFRVLEKVGLIHPAGTRQKRGTTEKYFKAAVERVEGGGHSAGMSSDLASALFEGVLASTLADLQRAGKRRPGRKRAPAAAPYLKRYRIQATPAQAVEIRKRLDALAALCERLSASEGATEFGLTLAFYQMPDATKKRKE